MSRNNQSRPRQYAGPAPRALPIAPSTSVPSIAVPDPLAIAKTQADQLISKIEQERGSRVLVYWLAPIAQIADGAVVTFFDQLRAIGKQEKIDLVLYTVGGATEIPWRLVTLVREFAQKFGVLIPHRAHSAGTLLAMGADEVVMTPLGTLGPIDPSRTHPLLPRSEGATTPEPISVQDMRHAMQFIREAGGPSAEFAYTPEAMANIFDALFDKIHPLAIGAIEQSYALAKLVARQCLSTHMDPSKEGPMIDHIVDTFCDSFKSHQYQIGRKEARDIGLKVVDAPPALEVALLDLMKFYTARQPQLQPGQSTTVPIAWLDSTSLHFVCDATFAMTKDQGLQPAGDSWRTY